MVVRSFSYVQSLKSKMFDLSSLLLTHLALVTKSTMINGKYLCFVRFVEWCMTVIPSNSWVPVVEYINEQFDKYLNEEVSINRKKVIPDARVHCCLYFIPPTGHR